MVLHRQNFRSLIIQARAPHLSISFSNKMVKIWLAQCSWSKSGTRMHLLKIERLEVFQTSSSGWIVKDLFALLFLDSYCFHSWQRLEQSHRTIWKILRLMIVCVNYFSPLGTLRDKKMKKLFSLRKWDLGGLACLSSKEEWRWFPKELRVWINLCCENCKWSCFRSIRRTSSSHACLWGQGKVRAAEESKETL